MSAKKRARKARIAAKRKAIGELQFNAEVARIARELRESEHPNESALAALDDGDLARWVLTQAPDCYRYQYARLRRGWVATTRGSRSAKRRARVNHRDSARVNRAMLRAEAALNQMARMCVAEPGAPYGEPLLAERGTRAIEDGFPFEALSEVAEVESWRKEVYRPIYHTQVVGAAARLGLPCGDNRGDVAKGILCHGPLLRAPALAGCRCLRPLHG